MRSSIGRGDAVSGTRAVRSLRRRWLLGAFLVASAALHAAALTFGPAFKRDGTLAKVSVLDVVIVKPEPLSVAPPAPESSPPAKRKIEPQRRTAPPTSKTLPAPQPERAPTVLSLPATQTPEERAFGLPATKPPAPSPPAAAQNEQTAGAALVPPAFNAAYLRNPAPRYPLAARRAGEQGTVLLRVLVTTDGVPAQVSVDKSSGSNQLDAAALEAVRTWRFVPARRGTAAVEAWVLVPVVFRLEGAS